MKSAKILLCASAVMLDDFTTQNGAIRVIPGSHTRRQLPQDVLHDPKAPHPQQILLLGQAGSVVVMNAHLWHGGLPNRTSKPRTALHAFYARGDKPQQQYQKQLLSPQLQANLSPQLCQLLALDDPRNDRLSTEVAVRSGFLK
ncbi:MAG: phytanoyl-CoA dioxygenase family protein [Planctomycetes bacterium]|nr:phytanoyl-CoA dioxygenase family protein [Planctomycetota bacterium]